MPGEGGTMLFDKLRPGQDGTEELFIKFESGGCPPYFKTDSHEGVGHGICRFFAALDRNIGHTFSFLNTRTGGGGGGENSVVRQEHVFKGVLKDTVNAGFKNLIDRAIAEGVIDGDHKAIGQSVHKFGLPYVEEAIVKIRDMARDQGNQKVLNLCNSLVDTINEEGKKFGLVSDQHGIERRGAEVHISIT